MRLHGRSISTVAQPSVAAPFITRGKRLRALASSYTKTQHVCAATDIRPPDQEAQEDRHQGNSSGPPASPQPDQFQASRQSHGFDEQHEDHITGSHQTPPGNGQPPNGRHDEAIEHHRRGEENAQQASRLRNGLRRQLNGSLHGLNIATSPAVGLCEPTLEQAVVDRVRCHALLRERLDRPTRGAPRPVHQAREGPGAFIQPGP